MGLVTSMAKSGTVSGPWGELEYVSVVLEPNDEFVSQRSELRYGQQGTRWFFESRHVFEVVEILKDSGLSASLINRLTSGEYLKKNEVLNCYEIRPPEDVIVSLRPEQRRALYPRMHPDRMNPFSWPFQLSWGGIEALRARPSRVPDAQIDRMRALSYRVGQSTRFADIYYVLGKATDQREELDILKFLARQPAVNLSLKISGAHSIPALAEYWGAHGRNKAILPLLESVAAASGVDSLDIIHLLPPFPRKVLNTFPSREGEAVGDRLPDCFWTALSFFSENPPDRHLDFVKHVLEERYEPAPLPREFGDLIMISDKETGNRIHACNYIAGDFVFTKNGVNPRRPWVIAALGEVVGHYLDVDLTITFHRLRPHYQK